MGWTLRGFRVGLLCFERYADGQGEYGPETLTRDRSVGVNLG